MDLQANRQTPPAEARRAEPPHADDPHAAALAQLRMLETQWLQARCRLLQESLDALQSYVDPREAYEHQGQAWEPLAAGAPLRKGQGFATLAELTAARNECRALALHNEFAINGHENRISYLVGTGHRYQVVARCGSSVGPEPLRAAQRVLDEFLELNAWHQRQQEIVRRRDRDGEVFLRLFRDAAGRTRVRFVEPWQVAPPPHAQADPRDALGIRTDPHDIETVEGYWLDDGELVSAEEIQHRKANVDANVKRGVPLFYPVRGNLARAERLLRNMAAVSDIQTAIALIRKHRYGTRSSLEELRSHLNTAQRTTPGTGTTYYQRFEPGTILDVSGDTDYDFPAQGLDASRYVLVLQAILRAVASRLVMPEFMLTSDASNANYASTLVAEGPAVKMFQRLQHDLMVDDRALLRRVLQHAADAGRLPRGLVQEVDIHIEPPSLVVRDALQEARVSRILLRSGVLSRQTMALRHGLDPAREAALRAAECRSH